MIYEPCSSESELAACIQQKRNANDVARLYIHFMFFSSFFLQSNSNLSDHQIFRKFLLHFLFGQTLNKAKSVCLLHLGFVGPVTHNFNRNMEVWLQIWVWLWEALLVALSEHNSKKCTCDSKIGWISGSLINFWTQQQTEILFNSLKKCFFFDYSRDLFLKNILGNLLFF